MCIMQRYAFVAVALVALVAGLHGSGDGARCGYGLLLLLLGTGGWRRGRAPKLVRSAAGDPGMRSRARVHARQLSRSPTRCR